MRDCGCFTIHLVADCVDQPGFLCPVRPTPVDDTCHSPGPALFKVQGCARECSEWIRALQRTLPLLGLPRMIKAKVAAFPSPTQTSPPPSACRPPQPPAPGPSPPSHWRDCHFADALSPSLLKHLLKRGVQQNGSLADGYISRSA